MALQQRDADLFGGARIDSRLVDHDVALLEGPPDRLAGLDQRRHVGAIGQVDRRRHRDDEDARLAQVRDVAAASQLRGGTQFVGRALERVVAVRAQFRDARGVDVEAEHGTLLAELDGQRQADIAEADDGDQMFIDLHEEIPLAFVGRCGEVHKGIDRWRALAGSVGVAKRGQAAGRRGRRKCTQAALAKRPSKAAPIAMTERLGLLLRSGGVAVSMTW